MSPQNVPNYALTERDAGFFAAARVVKRTGSYSTERAIAVAGQAAMLGGSLVVGIALTAILSMYVHKVAGGIVFLALCLGIVFVLMPYIDKQLWAMRAAFAYLVTKALIWNEASPATNASESAKKFLTEQFGDLGPVADAHNDVLRMVRKFFKTFDKLDSMLPIDLGPVRNALHWAIDRVAPRIADLALSYAVARGDRDFAESSKDAVAYVAQNPKEILGGAVRAYITERAIAGTIGFITMAIGFSAVFFTLNASVGDAAATSGVPAEGAQVMGIFAAIFGGLFVGVPFGMFVSWFIRTAFLEPIALTMIIIRFHATIQGQAVDPATRQRLAGANTAMSESKGLMGFFD